MLKAVYFVLSTDIRTYIRVLHGLDKDRYPYMQNELISLRLSLRSEKKKQFRELAAYDIPYGRSLQKAVGRSVKG